jgi:hypothetical protein
MMKKSKSKAKKRSTSDSDDDEDGDDDEDDDDDDDDIASDPRSACHAKRLDEVFFDERLTCSAVIASNKLQYFIE